MTRRGRRYATTAAGLLATILTLSSCASAAPDDSDSEAVSIAAPAQRGSIGDFPAVAQSAPVGGGAQAGVADTETPHVPSVPGLGPEMSARIPVDTAQVLVAEGPVADSQSGTLSFYEATDDSWMKLRSFDFHNGANGWLADRREGDETTPIGVFTLSDAGGFRSDPGTALPYTQNEGLSSSAETAYGSGYGRVFDYVIAIDYNRSPGTPPTDKTRPLGWDKGGGIWLHLDHDSPTHGCVTLEEDDLVWILRHLDPDAHPRIAMGPETDLQA